MAFRAKIFLLIILLFPVAALADPAISGFSGDKTHGSSNTITGTDFGASPITGLEWVGDDIESDGATYGDNAAWVASASPTGWAEELYPARLDSGRAYSGSWSLICDENQDDSGTFGLTYDMGNDPDFVYISYMVYLIDDDKTAYQWKMFRMMPVSDVEDADVPQWVIFNKLNFGGTSNSIFRATGESDDNTWNLTLPQSGRWERMEILLTPSSTLGGSDASAVVYVHIPGTSITQALNDSSKMSYSSTDVSNYLWRYAVFQNYMGNETPATNTMSVNMDDIYIAESQARVEIGNASTWGACTTREIQYPTAWSATSITITLNEGTLDADSGSNYLYVVDSDGTISDGYPIPTVGSQITLTGGSYP